MAAPGSTRGSPLIGRSMSGPAPSTPMLPVIGQADRKGRDSLKPALLYFFFFLIALKTLFFLPSAAVAAVGEREVQVRFPRLVFGGLPTRLPPPPTHRLQLKQLKKGLCNKGSRFFPSFALGPLLQLTARGGRRVRILVASKLPGSAAPRQDRGLECPPQGPGSCRLSPMTAGSGVLKIYSGPTAFGEAVGRLGRPPEVLAPSTRGDPPRSPPAQERCSGVGAQGLAFS